MFAVKGDGDYYETDMISTPCVLGIIKPKIYLTLNLTEKEKKYILTHENIHIKRKHLIISMWKKTMIHHSFSFLVNNL